MTRRVFGTRVVTGLAARLALTQRALAQNASEKAATPQDVSGKEISSDLVTPDVKRVGSRLRCLCGCAMTVGECNMVGCGHASPARIKIREMQKAGMTDDQIVDAFVKEEGIKILAAPPAKGFNWFGYTAPYILATVGAGFVALFIKRMKAPAAPLPLPNAEPVPLGKYEAKAAKDIEEMED